MAKQKAVMTCVHDPDSPVNNWPFKQCFSFVPQKTPVIPVETLFFLAANCCFWLLLILFLFFNGMGQDWQSKKISAMTAECKKRILISLPAACLNLFFVKWLFCLKEYYFFLVFSFVNSIIILMSHFWSALQCSKRYDWNDSKVFRRQVVRRMTCRSVRFAAAKAKTPFAGFGVCLNLCVFVCLCV